MEANGVTRAFLFGFGLGSAITWAVATLTRPVIVAVARTAVHRDTLTHAHHFHESAT